MTKKEDSEEVSKRLNQRIRQSNHSLEYYVSLSLLIFVIPVYSLLQFFYVYAGGWQLFDLIFVLILLAIALVGIYRESKL